MKRFALTLFFAGTLSFAAGCADVGTDADDVVSGETALDALTEETPAADTAVGWLAPVEEGKLGIGNPAPALQLAKVVHGEEVAGLVEGKVQVVEFWATWCGPCLAGMPHISKLAEKYKGDVNFVGITDEDEETVTKFLARNRTDDETWADTVKYSLALDDDNAMNKQYFRAAGQRGIPCAFIVGRDGIVEWIGHPMSMDGPLASVVEGSYDREGAYTDLIESKKSEAAQQEAMQALTSAMQAGDYDKALEVIEEKSKANPDDALNWEMVKMQVLTQAKRPEELNKVQAGLVEKQWDDSQFLNMIAWGIAAEGAGTDMELAMKAARRASELEKDSEPAILDTLARVYYETGDLAGAIEWQKKAVSSSDDEGAANDIAKTLKGYEEELAAKSAPAEEKADADDAKEEKKEEAKADDTDDKKEADAKEDEKKDE